MTTKTIMTHFELPLTLAQAFDTYWRNDEIRQHVALTDGTTSFTYAQLDEATQRIGNHLTMRGITEGEVLPLAMERTLDSVLIVLAAIRTGSCPVVLEPMLPGEEISRRLQAVDARWLVYDEAAGQMAHSLELQGIQCVPAAHLCGGSQVLHSMKADVTPDTRALLLFTSGSTGLPKAVALKQSAVLTNALGVIEHSELSASDRLLHVMPIYHTNGLNNQLFAPLLCGATVIFASRFRAEEMPALMARFQPTIITGVPTMYSRMLTQPLSDQALKNLRMARCGSAPITETLHREVEAALGCPLVVSYGLSEATCTSTMNPPHARRIGSVGTVLPGQTVKLREADGTYTDQPGREGEICITGRTLMNGYIGAEEATSRAVMEGWLRTGDLGRFDEDGYLHVTGRIKDVIIRGGENLSPLLIESVIMAETRAVACCVVGREDKDLGEVPVAFVVGDRQHIEPEQVRDVVRNRLSRIYVPEKIYFVDALPENSVGKVDRKALARQLVQIELAAAT